MGCIDTKGITPYYIDLNRKENADMKIKTKKYNLEYFKTQMTLNERINIKSWYPLLYERGLLYMLHLVNDVFMNAPCIESCENSIFACGEKRDMKTLNN